MMTEGGDIWVAVKKLAEALPQGEQWTISSQSRVQAVLEELVQQICATAPQPLL